jgi:anti-sigma factor RsiW
MTSSNQTQSAPNQPEELIAYLDGELNDAAAANVEERLARDPQVRQTVEKLTRAWDLLDLLPAARASSDFTERTLSAIGTQRKSADNADTKYLPVGPGRRVRASGGRWAIRVVGLIGLLIAAAVGFNGSFRRNAEPIDKLLTELPLIERLDQYQAVGDVEFLRHLASSGLFDEQSDSQLK